MCSLWSYRGPCRRWRRYLPPALPVHPAPAPVQGYMGHRRLQGHQRDSRGTGAPGGTAVAGSQGAPGESSAPETHWSQGTPGTPGNIGPMWHLGHGQNFKSVYSLGTISHNFEKILCNIDHIDFPGTNQTEWHADYVVFFGAIDPRTKKPFFPVPKNIIFRSILMYRDTVKSYEVRIRQEERDTFCKNCMQLQRKV